MPTKFHPSTWPPPSSCARVELQVPSEPVTANLVAGGRGTRIACIRHRPTRQNGWTVKRSIVALAVFALPVAGLTMVAQPASADPNGACSSGVVCLYENSNYNRDAVDHWANFRTDDTNFNNNSWLDRNHVDTGDGLNDETSSIKNRRGCTVVLFQNSGFSGARNSFAHGEDDSNLSDDDIDDNRASSLDIRC